MAKSHGVMKVALVGAGVAAAAASAFFLLGKNAKKHRAHAKAWAIRMKADVVEKLEHAKEMTEPAYHEIIDAVASDYKKGMKASKAEVDEVAADLKKHWKTVSALAKAAKGTVKKDVKLVVKKIGM